MATPLERQDTNKLSAQLLTVISGSVTMVQGELLPQAATATDWALDDIADLDNWLYNVIDPLEAWQERVIEELWKN